MKTSNIFGKVSTGVFGLDLGTTNSVVSVVSKGVPKTLESTSGKTTPSVVTFYSDGSVDIGKKAYEQRYKENTVYSFKKFMGTDKKLYGYTPRQISSIFVKNLLEDIVRLNPEYKNYKDVEVSVPAYFDANQRLDTKLAIEEAGYNVIGISDEPVSAALIYQRIKRIKGTILVFDLGGGTFDAVLIKNTLGVPKDSVEFYSSLGVELPVMNDVLEVLDITGDNHLGGDDIDEEMVKLYCKKHSLKPSKKEKEYLLLAAENVKIVGLPMTPVGQEHPMTFNIAEEATRKIIKKCLSIVQPMLDRSNISSVTCVLCGGSTKADIIRDTLEDRFPVNCEIDPDLSVSKGNIIKVVMESESSGSQLITRLAKGIGIFAGSKVQYLAHKNDILPFNKTFVTRNKTPFSSTIDIELYQGDRIKGTNTKVSTIELSGITGHDEQGFVEITIHLVITSDGEITVSVDSGSVKAQTTISVTSYDESNEEEEYVHPSATQYYRLKTALANADEKTLSLLNDYKETGDRNIARSLFSEMSKNK